MASIIPGTDASFTVATAEGQAVAAITFLNQRETTALANPNAEDRIDGVYDTDLLTFAGNFRLPAIQTLNDAGQLVIVATPYLNGGTFTPGTTGTFKSIGIEAYCLEVLMYIQNLELQPAKNPQNRNGVTGSYNSDTKLYTGTFNFPVTQEIGADGAVRFQAVEYLLT